MHINACAQTGLVSAYTNLSQLMRNWELERRFSVVFYMFKHIGLPVLLNCCQETAAVCLRQMLKDEICK